LLILLDVSEKKALTQNFLKRTFVSCKKGGDNVMAKKAKKTSKKKKTTKRK